MTNINLPFSKATVILTGASEWHLDPKYLPAIPGIKKNVTKLIETLTNPNILGISPNNVLNLLNLNSPIEVLTRIHNNNENSNDPLIFYYAGHGMIHKESMDILLTTSESTSQNAEISSIKYSELISVISSLKRPLNLIILDSCFSGRAHGTLGDSNVIIPKLKDLDGTIIITAVKGMNLASANPNDEITAFTQCIIDILNNGIDNGNDYRGVL